MSLFVMFADTFSISASWSIESICTVSFAFIFVVPVPNKEFTVNDVFKICIPSSFVTSFTTSFSSFEYTFADTSNATFIPIFLSFMTFASTLFTLVFSVACISDVIPSISMLSEKSNVVLNPLIPSSFPSGTYIIYVWTLPSNLIFPSCTSFLYIHAIPLVLIVFKTSGLESGIIISPSTNIISVFSDINLFIHKFSLAISTIFYIILSWDSHASLFYFIHLYVFDFILEQKRTLITLAPIKTF